MCLKKNVLEFWRIFDKFFLFIRHLAKLLSILVLQETSRPESLGSEKTVQHGMFERDTVL